MKKTLIQGATLVNEGKEWQADVLIEHDRIVKIDKHITPLNTHHIIDAHGLYLLPGMIDDQVHFREPGLTHKGSIASESRAAAAGGITSYMEMPNVNPATTTVAALEAKFDIAKQTSLANYSFYLGATESNIDEIKALDPAKYCGVKVFMGASTGDLLVEHPQVLDDIFSSSPALIVTHCESSPIIAENLSRLRQLKKEITISDHPVIRDERACYASSSYAVDLAIKYQSNLHVLHISTAKELELFSKGSVSGKNITSEACVHHLWFTEDDYNTKGNLIKCNPSVKSSADNAALFEALNDGRIDIIATDHAPHTLAEKQTDYLTSPAGLPLVESALLSLFDHVANNLMSLVQVVEKTAHNPAIRYKIDGRGFIREGYFADLVLVNPKGKTLSLHNNARYHCKWTPFDGHTFSAKIVGTWINGYQVFDGQNIVEHQAAAQRLAFNH